MAERILVLCYHAISDLSGDSILAEYGVPPTVFERQLDYLFARGFSFVSPDDLVGFLSRKTKVPERAVLLTFDDCYEELVDVARAILQPRDIRAIAFAVSGMASGTNEWDQRIGARQLQLLDSTGLRELRELGVEIGCHSRSHRCLPTLSDQELDEETRMAADDIEGMGLPRPRFLAFPHGEHDVRSRIAVQRAGFTAAFGLSRKRVVPNSDPFALPRLEILARDDEWRFRLKTHWPRMAPLLSPLPIHRRAAGFASTLVRKRLRPTGWN